MIKNEKSLIDRAKNYAVKNDITVNDVLQNFMFERFLERLSKSKYKDNFILKGGFLSVCIFFALSGFLSVISGFRKEKWTIQCITTHCAGLLRVDRCIC